MKRLFARKCGWLVRAGLCAVLAGALASAGVAQDSPGKKITQTAGVDNTPMGAYRALAELSFQAFKKGDVATAAELSRVLERTWDGAEGGGGDRSLGKTNDSLFEQIDDAMDAFIKPIINHAKQTPDEAAVETAYHAYLDKLKQGDQ
jgi:hypothetical protein